MEAKGPKILVTLRGQEEERRRGRNTDEGKGEEAEGEREGLNSMP